VALWAILACVVPVRLAGAGAVCGVDSPTGEGKANLNLQAGNRRVVARCFATEKISPGG